MNPSTAAFTRRFWQAGDFVATGEAEAFLRERGFSIAPRQGNENRGIMFGDCKIAKWRNLNAQERLACHGILAGNPRHGPVTVMIFPGAPMDARHAVEKRPAATMREPIDAE